MLTSMAHHRATFLASTVDHSALLLRASGALLAKAFPLFGSLLTTCNFVSRYYEGLIQAEWLKSEYEVLKADVGVTDHPQSCRWRRATQGS